MTDKDKYFKQVGSVGGRLSPGGPGRKSIPRSKLSRKQRAKQDYNRRYYQKKKEEQARKEAAVREQFRVFAVLVAAVVSQAPEEFEDLSENSSAYRESERSWRFWVREYLKRNVD